MFFVIKRLKLLAFHTSSLDIYLYLHKIKEDKGKTSAS